MHSSDLTLDSYTIKTDSQSHFSYLLQLVNFSENKIPNDELPFLSEIHNDLQNSHIELVLPRLEEGTSISNVISLINVHEKNEPFFSENLREEIKFVSQHFNELKKEEITELKNISIDTLERILCQKELQLQDENQLLTILNELYEFDSKYSILYKCIYFSIVDEENVLEFIKHFNIQDLDQEIWRQISDRLKQKVEVETPFKGFKNRL